MWNACPNVYAEKHSQRQGVSVKGQGVYKSSAAHHWKRAQKASLGKKESRDGLDSQRIGGIVLQTGLCNKCGKVKGVREARRLFRKTLGGA